MRNKSLDNLVERCRELLGGDATRCLTKKFSSSRVMRNRWRILIDLALQEFDVNGRSETHLAGVR